MALNNLYGVLQNLSAASNDLQAETHAVRLFQSAGEALRRSHDLSSALAGVLNVSMQITGADFGNIQLLDPSSGALKIVAQRGFGPRFLEFFNSVHAGTGTCGTAMQSGRSVFVQDVTASPIFRDNQTIEVMLEAECRSVRSFPLISDSGRLVGVMSSHYRMAKPCTPGRLFVATSLATRVANFIEHKQFQDWRAAQV